jgi:recombinase, xerC/D family
LYENTNNLTLKTGTVTFNVGNTAIGTYSDEFEHFFEKSFKTKCVGVFKQMSKSTIRDRVRKIGKLVGIENLYPHSLRKTSINLIAKTAGIDLASEFTNHSGTDVTKKHYVKKTSVRERKNKLLEIRKIAGF